MKVLVTGAAGFIGFHLTVSLSNQGHEVIGIDNINTYYDTELKYGRLAIAGIHKDQILKKSIVGSTRFSNYSFMLLDITDKEALDELFSKYQFDVVCNLAAQAGVRYSIKNPYTYIESNVVGFMNILEACRHYPVKHLVFASSSSIYGLNAKVPYSEDDKADSPISLYAATKKSGELMAHSYSKLYGIRATGLRFFTVYGPWGRPDMAPFLFMDAIMHDRPIRVFNHGDLQRDFTYIDDIIQGINLILPAPPTGEVPFRIYNIGNAHPIQLMDFIHTIEDITGKEFVCNYTDMQPGDVQMTYADITKIKNDFGYHPSTSIRTGLEEFFKWYKTHIF